MRKSTIYLFVLGLAIVGMTALVSAGLVVSAQNSNSSTTMAPTMAPTNKAAKRTPRKHKRVAKSTGMTYSGPCDPMKQEQTDLSGTYTGTINYPDAGLTGDATLTITGNNFSLTAGSTTQSGRVTAVTTCGYIAATMMFGDLAPQMPSPNPPPALPAVSVRVRKMGDRVSLMTVPGEKRSFSFGTAGTTPKRTPRRHKRTSKPKTDTPATTPKP